MFQPGAYEPTGLKTDFQLKKETPRPGDVFVYFGEWVCCVKTIGGNFSITYNLNQDTFGVAALTGVDTRCVGSPRTVVGIDIHGLRERYQASQQILATRETPAFLDDTEYAFAKSDLDSLILQLIANDGFLEGKKTPMESRRIRLGTYDGIKVDDKGNVKEAIQKTKKIHCGRAALALSGEVTHITHPAIFQDLPPGRWINIFSTANPFARKSNQPHVLP